MSTPPGTRMIENRKLILWVILAIVVVLLIPTIKFATPKESQQTGGTSTKKAEVEVQQPKTRYIEVSTEWYDPNELALRQNIQGRPIPNTGNGLKWQVRARYNNGSSRIVDMLPIDVPQVSELTDLSGAQGITTVALDYRVTPGQSRNKCTFKFEYSPWH